MVSANTSNSISQITIIVAGIIGCLVFVSFVYFLWRVLWRLLRFFRGQSKIFGALTAMRLVSFGLVTIIFPGTIYKVIHHTFLFIVNLISLIFININYTFLELKAIPDPDLLKTVMTTFAVLQKSALEVFAGLRNLLIDLPITRIFLAIALWVVVGQIVTLILAKTEPEPKVKEYLLNFINNLKRIPLPTRKNFLLLLIFILSGYLCIASIAAIPWLKQTEAPPTFSREQFKSKLKAIQLTKEAYDKRYAPDYSTNANPFERLEQMINMIENSFNNEKFVKIPFYQQSKSDIETIKTELGKQKGLRKELADDWKKFQADAWAAQNTLLENAAGEFESNMNLPMSTEERTIYLKNMSKWYQDNLDRVYRSLNESMRFLSNWDRKWEGWALELSGYIDKANNNFNEYANASSDEQAKFQRNTFDYSLLFMKGSPEQRYLEDSQAESFQVLRLPINITLPPQLPEPGIGWGIFGIVSRWLLKTRSIDLAIISGMLGFGLLGSAVSSFVRGRIIREKGEALVGDLSGVLIKGLSAAVIVFLAVEGGIAFFTTGEIAPNPYVLFFTCLVGAAFSENIWEWARERLGKSFPKNDVDTTSMSNNKK